MTSNRLSHRRRNARLPPICKKPPKPPPPIAGPCNCGCTAVWYPVPKDVNVGLAANSTANPPASIITATMHSLPTLAWANPYIIPNGYTGVIDILPVPPGTTSIQITADILFENGDHCTTTGFVYTPGA